MEEAFRLIESERESK